MPLAEAADFHQEVLQEGVQAGFQDLVDAAKGERGFEAAGLAQGLADWALATRLRLATILVMQCDKERGHVRQDQELGHLRAG